MLFEMSFGLTEEGAAIRKVVDQSLAEGKVTEDLAAPGQTALSTSEVGDYLVSLLQ
jgi:3-isopropylmalate dehydrogenase